MVLNKACPEKAIVWIMLWWSVSLNLKSECFYLDEFSNISELKDAVTEYIEYYNSRRISLKLKGLTPIEHRNQTYMPRLTVQLFGVSTLYCTHFVGR